MTGSPIIVRLELEEMHQAIMHAFTEHQLELSKMVDEQLQNIVDNFDWAGTVEAVSKQVIKEAVESAVKDYFNYGDGRKYIQQVISDTITKAIRKKGGGWSAFFNGNRNG